ncbi:MAG: hypothetical protein KDK70_20145, partial [Myxococcales bacterium]|nr:hypothetical protein [Myxococcales bacterium]
MSLLTRARDRAADSLLRITGRLPAGAPPRAHAWIPGLGHALGVMRSPAAFQRRGHQLHGPVFSTEVLGHQLVFVDPVGAPEIFEKFVRAPPDELSLTEAYKVLVGRVVGKEIFVEIDKDLRTGLSKAYIERHIGSTAEYAAQLVHQRLPGPQGRVDVLSFANAVIFNVVAYYVVGREVAERRGDAMAELMHLVESDYSVLGMLLPVETPSMRRRSAAFERLLQQVLREVEQRVASRDRHDDYMQY